MLDNGRDRYQKNIVKGARVSWGQICRMHHPRLADFGHRIYHPVHPLYKAIGGYTYARGRYRDSSSVYDGEHEWYGAAYPVRSR